MKTIDFFNNFCRGYFPKGGGEVRITAEPVRFIRPINITDAGHLTRITGRAFTAGVLPVKVHIPPNSPHKYFKQYDPEKLYFSSKDKILD